jgi:hypothetical protein
MGNTQSNILERLDDIASEYILDADYRTLSKMKDKDYCNKVTIVTKDILDKQFDYLDIEYLATRTNSGWKWDSLFRSGEKNAADDTVKYPSKDKVGYITKIDNPNKEEMCMSISTFYVKIGHIFSAIVGTIKPRYVFGNGETHSILTPKKDLPTNDDGVFQLSENGFCYKRIEALRFGTNQNSSAINPQFCNANNSYPSANEIPGVPEFEMLYYDDTDEKGNPIMSERSLSIYRKDLTTFYKKFTDEPSLPNDIHKFSEIQLKQYNALDRCVNNKYNQPIAPIGNSRESSLFEDYAANLREMIQVTGDLQQNLVEILNKIFTKKSSGGIGIGSGSNDKEKITIQPKLTMAMVDQLIVDTRNKLLELYLRCEEYFENGVNIYKAIVNDRIINNTFEEFLSPDQLPPPSNANIGPEPALNQSESPSALPAPEEDVDSDMEKDEYPVAEDEVIKHNEINPEKGPEELPQMEIEHPAIKEDVTQQQPPQQQIIQPPPPVAVVINQQPAQLPQMPPPPQPLEQVPPAPPQQQIQPINLPAPEQAPAPVVEMPPPQAPIPVQVQEQNQPPPPPPPLNKGPAAAAV